MPDRRLAVQYKNDAPLAQLDRASGFEPEGWGFKSLGVRHVFSSEELWLSLAFFLPGCGRDLSENLAERPFP